MKFWLDLEFHEYFKNNTSTIDLISIGLIDERDNEFYQINSGHNVEDSWSDDWLRENVLQNIYNELIPKLSKNNFVLFLQCNFYLRILDIQERKSQIRF